MGRLNYSERLLKEQSGAALILVALSMFMIFSFAAMVVDVGSLYVEKSRLQKALDAAVLGGGQVLKVSRTEAKSVGISLAKENGFSVRPDEVTTGDDFIEIHKTVNKNLTFARVLGIHSAEVSAFARAELQGSLQKGKGVIPVGLDKTDYKKGALYALNDKPGQGNSGNYGYLAIDGNGANVLGTGIKYGSQKTVEVGKNVLSEPGQNWGKVEEGFEYRVEEDRKNNPKCSSYEKADKTCKRVVIVPLVDDFKNGRSEVEVLGFAAFWIDSIHKHEINGRFIEIVSGGTFGPGEDYGIHGVKLVN